MKILTLIYFSTITSIMSVYGQSLDSLIGTWNGYDEKPLDSTSEVYILKVNLISHNLDSITWSLNKTEVVGWITDTSGSYTGSETYNRIEFGTGQIIKDSVKGLVLSLNLTRNSFLIQNQKINLKYIIKNIIDNYILLESTNNQIELKLKKQYITEPKRH